MSPPSDFPWAPAVGIGLPVGAFAAGFIKTKSGKRVWDHYFAALRDLEGTIPMGMLETFHFSEIISPLAAPNSIELLAREHPELFKNNGFPPKDCGNDGSLFGYTDRLISSCLLHFMINSGYM